ncbi:MAG: glycosyltransferase family 4 protein [bacterium]|nr:glycosyltransferase family 4 protein [bacterium]
MTRHIVIDARIRPSSTGRYADRLLEHLQKLDSENRYTILLDPQDSWQAAAPNFTTLTCPFEKFSFNPLDQLTYGRFLRKLQPDLVHFTMTPLEPVFYRGLRVTTTHDLTMLRFTRAGRLPLPLHWLRMAGYRFLFWYSHRASKKIIAISNFVKQDLIKLHPFAEDKTEVILESSEPPLPGKSQPLTGFKQPFIMHVGSPFPHKNIERLVDAFELLKAKHPDLQLVLAGKREYYFKLLSESISTNKFKNDIIIPGFVSDAELKWLYENTSCYVLPSLSEGFGLPGLEAMAHNAPVASSNTTCLPEIYGEAAAYFDPFDINDITAVVDKILTDSSYANKIRTLGQERLGLFSWEKMAKDTLAVYRKVLGA